MKILIRNKGCVREEIATQKLRDQIIAVGHEQTYKVREADIIVYITCAGLGNVISDCLTEIEACHQLKKDGALLIITGCLTKFPAFVNKYANKKDTKVIKNMDFVVPILNIINDENKSNTEKTRLDSCTRHFFNNNAFMQVFLCYGCTNNCSFCKTNYLNEPLTSIPYELALKYLQNEVKKGTKHIVLSGQNLTLYGIDLYKRPRLHEFIHELSQTPGLEYLTINEINAQNMYPALLQELKSNPKVISVSIQLETASDPLLDLTNRHYNLDEYDEIAFSLIQSGKFVNTVLMSGLPTETYEDLDITIKYLKDRGILTEQVCKYCDFFLLPSSKFEQLSENEKNRHTKYLLEALKKVNYEILINNMDNTANAIVTGKENNKVYFRKFYTGYSIKKEHQNLEHGDIISVPAKRLVYNQNTQLGYFYRY